MHRTFTLTTPALWLALAVAGCSRTSGPGPQTDAGPAAPSTASAACTADQLAFELDRRDGMFDGMSHSGTMLVLRNAGISPCSLPALPEAVFLDASHQPLRTVAQPEQAPAAALLLAPGAQVESAMRWVSGDVYEHGRCLAPAYLGVVVDGRMLSAAFAGQVCGPGDQPPAYAIKPFQPAAAQQ